MSQMRVIGIDLAWGEGSEDKLANETGLVAAEPSGEIVDAGWARGLDETVAWVERVATADTLLMVDAPLVVSNASHQRLCEKQVSERYMHPWKVGANSTNKGSKRLAGAALLGVLEPAGWRYHDGCSGLPPASGRHLAEVFPYTTLVGAPELGYDLERPIYKPQRRPKSLTSLSGDRNEPGTASLVWRCPTQSSIRAISCVLRPRGARLRSASTRGGHEGEGS